MPQAQPQSSNDINPNYEQSVLTALPHNISARLYPAPTIMDICKIAINPYTNNLKLIAFFILNTSLGTTQVVS